MPTFACNIDRRGRRVRAISGVIFLALSILAFSGWLGAQAVWARYALGGVLGLLGAFQLFEAWKGWCAVRALGIKTRI